MTNNRMHIVDLDAHALNPGDLDWTPIRELGELTVWPRTAPEDIIGRAGMADALLINKIRMTRQLMEQLPHLRYIGELATGTDNIDLEAASQLGITVTNIPAYSTASVAQHVFALLLAAASRAEHYAEATRVGEWSRCADFCYWDTPLLELAGRTIGIIGLGNIGRQVARIAHAFGMNVVATTSKAAGELPDYVCKTPMDELLAVSDVVTLHCPLTADNRRLICDASLTLMRPSAILINTARGGLVDEESVARALHDGRLRAYCADVLTQEPPKDGSPLLAEPNAYITPHLAWATLEARTRLLHIAADNLRAFQQGRPVNQVNR